MNKDEFSPSTYLALILLCPLTLLKPRSAGRAKRLNTMRLTEGIQLNMYEVILWQESDSVGKNRLRP